MSNLKSLSLQILYSLVCCHVHASHTHTHTNTSFPFTVSFIEILWPGFPERVLLRYPVRKCQKKNMGISGWVPSTNTSHEHLLHPSSLTFPMKAHSERAAQWALPTRGMKHLTAIRAFNIPQIFLLACCKDPDQLVLSGRVDIGIPPRGLSGPNTTGWILKPSPFPLAWGPRGV